MTNEAALDGHPDLHKEAHPNCVVCGPKNESGLRLEFDALEDGSVQTHFGCDGKYEGFPGVLHGGVISSLLDGAMTNCLFAHGHTGITGELRVRFRYPVATGRTSRIRAWIEMSAPPFYALKAELIQDQQVKAKATGKFMEQADFQLSASVKTVGSNSRSSRP
ncbi:MAG: PaaI family thioesterase [Candidatus Nealsonbacteria bacterium]|nr:PaaI family thioesterase [Candidatus Nealsonbacteria bacterium]